jgi:hypothetical protein
VTCSFTEEGFKLVASRKLKEGERLSYWMGEVGSAESVWKFGFIDHSPSEDFPKGNPFDFVPIEPELVLDVCSNEEDPLLEEKVMFLDVLGLNDCFPISLTDPQLPRELLLYASVLLTNEAEFEAYREKLKSKPAP